MTQPTPIPFPTHASDWGALADGVGDTPHYTADTVPGTLDAEHTRIINSAGGRLFVVPKPDASRLSFDRGAGPLWFEDIQRASKTLGRWQPVPPPKPHWSERLTNWVAELPLTWMAAGTLVMLAASAASAIWPMGLAR